MLYLVDSVINPLNNERLMNHCSELATIIGFVTWAFGLSVFKFISGSRGGGRGVRKEGT